MKVEDVINLTPGQRAKLSRSELAKATQVLASAGNKRLQRLEKADLARDSPAYQFIKRGGGKFSTKGLDTISLNVEFTRVQIFLKKKTSTITGTQDYLDARDKATHEWLVDMGITDDYINWSKSKKKRFWRLFNNEQIDQAMINWIGPYDQKSRKQGFAIAIDLFGKYERKEDIFSQYHRGHMKGSTKAFRNAFEAILKTTYEEKAEIEAKAEEEQKKYFEGKYGVKM